MDLIQEAKLYIHHGFAVVPLTSGLKFPKWAGGYPDGGCLSIEAFLEHPLARLPNPGIGLSTGMMPGSSFGIFVIDVDCGFKRGRQMGGDKKLSELLDGRILPKTAKSNTPSGGYHLFFKISEPVGKFKLGDIDFQGNGAGVALPPTVIDGKRYSWEPGLAPWEIGLADLPDYVLGWATKKHSANQAMPGEIDKFLSGQRNFQIPKLIGAFKNRGFSTPMIREMLVAIFSWPSINDFANEEELAKFVAVDIDAAIKSSLGRMEVHEVEDLLTPDFEPSTSSNIESDIDSLMEEYFSRLSEMKDATEDEKMSQRPKICLSGDDSRDARAIKAVIKHVPRLFIHGSSLAVLDDESSSLSEATNTVVRARLNDLVRVGEMVSGKSNEVGEKPTPVFKIESGVSEDLVKLALGQENLGAKPLKMLVRHPLVAPDGSLLIAKGYDPSTGIYLNPPPGFAIDDVFETEDTILPLVKSIKEDLLKDIFFSDPKVDMARVFALLLTPFARFAYQGSTPMFFAHAKQQGTGKSAIFELVHRIVYGVPLVADHWPDRTEELEKRLTSIFKSGRLFVSFDNIPDGVTFDGGSILSSMLTSTTRAGRTLGKSSDDVYDNNVILTASGNNISIIPDLYRRTVPINLTFPPSGARARSEHEWLAFLAANRFKFMEASIRILRWHLTQPALELDGFASYVGWSSVVRGAVVRALGLIFDEVVDPKPLAKDLVHESVAALDGVYEAGYAYLGENPIKVSSLFAQIEREAELVANDRREDIDPLTTTRAAISGLTGFYLELETFAESLGEKYVNWKRYSNAFGRLIKAMTKDHVTKSGISLVKSKHEGSPLRFSKK